jgi:hypothetical protein
MNYHPVGFIVVGDHSFSGNNSLSIPSTPPKDRTSNNRNKVMSTYE